MQHSKCCVLSGVWVRVPPPAPRQGAARPAVMSIHDAPSPQRVGFTKALRAGVKIAYGTDACVYPHGNNAQQSSCYVDHGLSAAQAIQSATSWAAELTGWKDRVGSLTPGTHADLVIVEGNPLDDIGCWKTSVV